MVMVKDRPRSGAPGVWTADGVDRDLLAAVQRGAPPREIVLIARGVEPAGDVVPFHMLTGALEAVTRDYSSYDATLAKAPLLRGTTSSNSPDLHRSRMKPSALESMRVALLDDMTAFMNHSYSVPEDVLGRFVEAGFTKRHDPASNVTWTDLDVGALVVAEADNPRAMQIYRQVKQKIKLGFSIGAYILSYSWEEEDSMEPVELSEEETACVSFFGPPPGVVMAVEEVMLIESSSVGIPSNRRSWARSLSWDAQIFESLHARAVAAGEGAPKRAPWASAGKTYSLPAARAAREAAPASTNSTHGEAEGEPAAEPARAGQGSSGTAAQQTRGDHGPKRQRAAVAGSTGHDAPPQEAAQPRGRRAGPEAPEGAAQPAGQDTGDHGTLMVASGGGGGGGGGAVSNRGENDGTAGSPYLTTPFAELEAQARAVFDYEGGAAMEKAGLFGRAEPPREQRYWGKEDARAAAEDRDPDDDEEEDEEEEPQGAAPAQADPDSDEERSFGPLPDQRAYDDEEEPPEPSSDSERSAQLRRSTRYAIGVKRGGNVVRRESYAGVPDKEWGDPANYRYPMPDAEHTEYAAERWDSAGGRSGYTKREQEVVERRIARRLARFGAGEEADAAESAGMGEREDEAARGSRPAQTRSSGAEYSHLLTWATKRVANCRGETLTAQQVDDLLGLHGLLERFLAERGLLAPAEEEEREAPASRALALVHPQASALRGGSGAREASAEDGGDEAELRGSLAELGREIAAAEHIRDELIGRLGAYTRQAAQMRGDLRDFQRALDDAEQVSVGRPTARGTFSEREMLERSQGISREELMLMEPMEAVARMRAEMDA